MKCKYHPKYKGIHKPTQNCLTCWKEWLREHQDAMIKGSDFLRILTTLENQHKAEINNLARVEWFDDVY